MIMMLSTLLVSLDYQAAQPSRPHGALIAGIPFFFILILVIPYFLPSIIAFLRKHHNSAAILLLNIFLGWTIIAWIACLVWALTATQREQTINIITPAPTTGQAQSSHPVPPDSGIKYKNFCSKCGSAIQSEDAFCSTCGARLK